MPRPPRHRSDRPVNGARAAGRAEAGAAHAPRIIGGDLRGRRLFHQPGERTRPMKDRVRETLFDLLGDSVRGCLALDLFAGTGALGFEALSRGAERAVFVERHFPTADALRRSARDLGVGERCDVRSGDVLLWSRRMPDLPGTSPWIVFVSPPWSFFAERGADLLALIDALLVAAPAGSTLVVESDTGFTGDRLPGASAWRSRDLPPAVLHLRRT